MFLYSGLPHGSKPPPLTVHHPYGNSQKISGRSIAAVSPLQIPSHANNVFSTFSGGSNPTLAATRTSSFAAALCKLAKQAIDPAIEKELSPITPTSSPTQSQQSVSSKRPLAPSYFSTSQGTISLGSPPIVTMAPSQEHISHVVDTRKAIELTNLSQGNSNASTNDRLVEPLSLKLEATKPAPLGLHFEKRNDHILTGKDFSVPSSMPGQLRPPPPLTSSHSDDSHSSSRGFQPYRSIDDTHHPLHSHVSPYDHTIAAYPYSSAFLPPRHLSHPTYRLEDSLYLERYNLPRAPMMHLHTPPGMLPHPSVPFYPNSRFPSDLLSHHMGLVSPSSMSFTHERQKQEEEHSREIIQEQEIERTREDEHDRREYDNRWEREHHEMEVDVVSGGNDSGRTACSPLPMTLSRNSESPMGRLGSITQGTPRDFVIRKSVTTVTSVVAPLNLAVHPTSGQRSNSSRVEKDMWPTRQVDPVADRVHLPQEQEGIGYRHPLLLQQIQHHPSNGRERILIEGSRETDNLIKHSMHPPGRNNHDTKLHKTSISDTNIHSANNLGVPNTELNGLPRGEHVHNSAFVQLTDSRESQKNIYTNHDHRSVTDIRGNENGSNKNNAVPMSDLWAAPSHLRHEGIHARLLETERTRNDNQVHGLSRERLHRNHHIDDNLSGRSMYHYPTGNRQTLARNLPETVILPPIGKTPMDTAMTTLDQPRVVSKLDLEEEKIRKARLNGTYNSDESESDSEEENDLNKLNSMLIITKGPPLKLDTSVDKMKFLNMFGLITNRKKRDLEFQKFLKRRRILGRRSISPPVELEEEEQEKRDITSPLPIPSKEITESLRMSADYEEKVKVLRLLDLKPLVPDKKKEREKIWKTIPEENQKNGIVKPICDAPNKTPPSHISSKGIKRKLCSEDRNHNRLLLNNGGSSPLKLPSTSKNSEAVLPLTHRQISSGANKGSPPPLVSTPSQRVPSITPSDLSTKAETSQDRKNEDPNQRRVVIFSHALPKDKSCQFKKDFVQEFHESVLQTTQQQLEHSRLQHTPQAVQPPPLNHSAYSSRYQSTSNINQSKDSELHRNHERKHEHYLHRWPGIEAVMEAYERYLSEQKLEQEVLSERCNYLRIQHQELNREAELISQRMSNLIQIKHQLDEERYHLQHAISKLKSCLQQLR